ncbi:methionine synthase, vitamin-B12 independent [Teratosphaeria destructans]|uniref:Methionine synthase, vitamin-B12 independent n=1 Tax=Teratosphaeria destructans TaxID=418781 RepID=A0A9W7SZ53_9PEZI|nr:methionine synthase, vitamin-B12 independent [Teratosphaeria destructans]
MPPPFRVDHIGSLIRPQYLVNARKPFNQVDKSFENYGPGGKEQAEARVNESEKRAIADVIAEQLERGVEPITSGEFERSLFCDGFFESLEGIETKFLNWEPWRKDVPANRPLIKWGLKGRTACIATAPVRWTRSAYLDDWLYVRSLLPEDKWKDVKYTLPSPTWYQVQLRDGSAYERGIYESDEEYLKDIAVAMRQEIMTLYDAGLRLIQIDDPNMTFFCDPDFIAQSEQDGLDVTSLVDLYMRTFNIVLDALPPDLTVAIHLCRGNYTQGVYLNSGGYENIANKLFNSSNFKQYYLEFDSERAGDFTPLRHLPSGKAVVLGVVTTKYAEMEPLDQVKAKVLQAADEIASAQGRTQRQVLDDSLAISPQCGFSSSEQGTGVRMTEEIQWRKLELLRMVAKELWPAGFVDGESLPARNS